MMKAPASLTSLLRAPVTAGLVFAFGAGLALWRLLAFRSSYRDSWAPMQTATDYLATGAPDSLYQNVFFERGIKFQYPPSSLLYTDLLRPLTEDSVPRLNFVNGFWLGLGGLALAVFAALLFADGKCRPWRWLLGALALVASMVYFPNVITYRAGQIQVFMNLIYFVSCLALLVGAQRSAGALTGLATAIKPQLAPFLLLGMLRRQWGFVAGMIACGAMVGLVSILRYGWANHVEYLGVLSYLSKVGESYYWNDSVNGIAHRLVGNGPASGLVYTEGIAHSAFPPYHRGVHLVTMAATLLFTATPFVAALATWRRQPDIVGKLLLFTLAGVCFVMASPIAWILHYGVILPGYLVVLRAMLDRQGEDGAAPRWSLAALGVSFLLTCFEPTSDPAYQQGLRSLLIVPTFYGGLLLVILTTRELLLRRPGPEPARAA